MGLHLRFHRLWLACRPDPLRIRLEANRFLPRPLARARGLGLYPGKDAGVSLDLQASLFRLVWAQVRRDESEYELRGAAEHQVGGRRRAQPGADRTGRYLDNRGTARRSQFDRDRRAVRVVGVQEEPEREREPMGPELNPGFRLPPA